MTVAPLVGHDVERGLVSQAIRRGRLPNLLLLTGSAGVGKQRFGLWIAQAILCQTGTGEPCGTCQSCRMVLELGHPDLHWVVPVTRPKAAEPAKQVEEVAQAISEVMAERRKDPNYLPPDGLAGHFVATARLIQRRAAVTPALARKKVFLVASADRLVPQEASQEAANALLKLFEEPPADTVFVLTVVDPNSLLPTIRSRAVPLRLGRLRDEQVADHLARTTEVKGQELERLVAMARGSIGQALALGEDEVKAARAAEELLRSVVGGRVTRAERVLRQGTFQARGEFASMLEALSHTLAEAARQASGVRPRRKVPESLERSRSVGRLLRAAEAVGRAREAAQGNANPQLVLAVLQSELAEGI